MSELIKTDDNLYWVERRENFVKLCFAFTPEWDEDLTQLDYIYAKISEKIALSDYDVFCVCIESNKRIIKPSKSFVNEGYAQVLVPKNLKVTISQIEQLLVEKRCDFSGLRKNFYSLQIAYVQESLTNSIVIAGSTFAGSKEFVSCPENPLFLAPYCVDIYGKGVENIDWGI